MEKRLWTGFVLCLLAIVSMTAKPKEEKAYKEGAFIYGMAISLTDSTVFVTEIQNVGKASINAKTGFLEGRTMYSEQLRSYLERIGMGANMACAVSFHEKSHKLQKKYQKVTAKYGKKKGVTLKTIKSAEFTFEPVAPLSNDMESNQE